MIFETWKMTDLLKDETLDLYNRAERFAEGKLQAGFNAENGEFYNYWETPVMWDYRQFPHMLICGSTGSGKTVAAKYLLHWADRIYRLRVWLCDFKNDDFKFCGGLPRFYSYGKCALGLDEFYKTFKARQDGRDTSKEPIWLVFDEWSAYLTACDKKQAEDSRAKLGELLMMGRAYGVSVLSIQQMAYKEDFGKARDNFGAVLAMGEISKELKETLFSEVREQMRPVEEIGIGYFRQGNRLTRIWVPNITNEKVIKRLVER